MNGFGGSGRQPRLVIWDGVELRRWLRLPVCLAPLLQQVSVNLRCQKQNGRHRPVVCDEWAAVGTP
jgi:hypothetical protein